MLDNRPGTNDEWHRIGSRHQSRPSKLELLAGWLPNQPWLDRDAGDLRRVAAYRFVDPDGEVGTETLLVASGDRLEATTSTAQPLGALTDSWTQDGVERTEILAAPR